MAKPVQNDPLARALELIQCHCPRLASGCYWAGTSSISMEELHHRQSFDLDFHTRQALQDIRPILAEIQSAFPGQFKVMQAPDAFGSGFQGVLELPDGEQVTIEVLSSYENAAESDLVQARTVPGLMRVTLARYLADKIQCVAERNEARDLVDIWAALRQRPDMEGDILKALGEQDALMILERLLGWTDEAIADDLSAYTDVNPEDASACRDRLIGWLKPSRPASGGEA